MARSTSPGAGRGRILITTLSTYSIAMHLFYDHMVLPTDEAFGLGGKLFALLRPSLLLASQAADEAGRRLHLASAALGILQQRLAGEGKGRLKGQQEGRRRVCQEEIPSPRFVQILFISCLATMK